VSLNGYRNDDFRPYLYVSQDMGTTWTALHGNLPPSPINVVKEDPTNPNILYVGTDNGAYVSIDGGAQWHAFKDSLPNVAVHDLVIQPDKNHLLLGTHGRSIYKVDLQHIQQLTQVIGNSLHLFPISDIDHNDRWGQIRNVWSEPLKPKQTFVVFSDQEKSVDMHLTTKEGVEVYRTSLDLQIGLNYLTYDLTIHEENIRAYQRKYQEIQMADDGLYYLPKGKYRLYVNENDRELIIK
jgi:hypothetical protein